MTDPEQDGAGAETEVSRWRYIGGVDRVYPHVPVTVQEGAVIEHVGRPAEDGCWEAAGESEVTHRPDNAPVEEEIDDDDSGAYDDGTDSEQQQFQLDESAGE